MLVITCPHCNSDLELENFVPNADDSDEFLVCECGEGIHFRLSDIASVTLESSFTVADTTGLSEC